MALAALFLGILLTGLLAALLALGAFGTALASIRMGKSEMVGRAALGTVYLLALIASVVLGFGADGVFTDFPERARAAVEGVAPPPG